MSLRFTFCLPAHWLERTCLPVSVGIAGLQGRPPQRQTRGLELAAEHKTGETPTLLCWRELLSDFWTGTPTTNLLNPSATPDVLDIVITMKLSSSVYLTSKYTLSSDHFLVVTDTACRSSFQHKTYRPDFRRTDWAKFQTHLEDQIPFNLELHNELAIGMGYAWWTGYRDIGKSPGTLLWEPRSAAFRGRWPVFSTSAGSTNGVQHSNPLIPKTNRCGGWPNLGWEFLPCLLPGHPGGIALSDSEKAEALAESLETQFRSKSFPSIPAVNQSWRGSGSHLGT